MDTRTKRVVAYIEEHINEPLSLTQLSDVGCLSIVQLSRNFKSHTGLTPALYVEFCKVRYSLDLIRDFRQVQDIASELGFTNYETFSRAFKRHCRIAPGDLSNVLRQIHEETDPDMPVVVSRSERDEDLLCLVQDSLRRNIYVPEQLSQLQVCIVIPKNSFVSSRQTKEKFQLTFAPEKAARIVDVLNQVK